MNKHFYSSNFLIKRTRINKISQNINKNEIDCNMWNQKISRERILMFNTCKLKFGNIRYNL